jgi:hypothetical protein
METNKRGRKSNEIEYEQRIPYLMELMIFKKLSYTEFKETVAKEYNVTTRTAEQWWADIRKRLKERFSQEQEEVLQDQLMRYYDLMEAARSRGNTRVVREVLADLNKLYGLESPQKLDVTSGGEPISINIVLDK